MPTGTIYKINKSGKNNIKGTGFIHTAEGYPTQVPFIDIPLPPYDIKRGDTIEFSYLPGTRTVAEIKRKVSRSG